MWSLVRLCRLAFAAVLLALGGWLAARSAGLPVPDFGLSDLRRLAAEGERSQALNRRCQDLFARSEARRDVVLELLDERLTLRQAVSEFRRLSEADGEGGEELRVLLGGVSADEALARSVLFWAAAELAGRPAEQRDAALLRLTDAYAEAFERPSPGEAGPFVREDRP
jgi:hypothetical protein